MAVQTDIDKAVQQAQAAQRVKEHIDQVKGVAQSRGAEVSVACDAAGRILDLRLAPSAVKRAANDLAALILATAHQAHQDAANKTIRIAQIEFGQDSPFTNHIAKETETQLAKQPTQTVPHTGR
jgi:DNA-binding protein YbaB